MALTLSLRERRQIEHWLALLPEGEGYLPYF